MSKSPVNILFITHYPSMYGANQSLCKLIIELRDFYQIKPIVLIPTKGPICDVLDQNGIKYFISHFYWWVNYNHGLFQKLLNIRKQLINLTRIPSLINLVKNENIDLVYSNSIVINIGHFISKKLQKPHIWHIREAMESYNLKFTLGDSFARKFLSVGADQYIVISDFIKESYLDLLPLNKIKRIYNGVSFVLDKPRESNTISENINLCCVGIICKEKNQLDILIAIKILKERGKGNVILHLVGGAKEDYLAELQQFITINSLEGNVIMHGHKNNVNEVVNTMNVGIMPSIGEGFGRVSIEYMLHKMPVIANDSGANVEIILNGLNGFLYNKNDAVELANNIEYFINNPEEMERMGRIAYEFAELNFSSKQNSNAINQVIQELLAVTIPKEKY
jgi:glycosyltransferase involved in cell wall biosynthesis